MKLVNVEKDSAIIETANKDARDILKLDPELKSSENKLLSFEISRVF